MEPTRIGPYRLENRLGSGGMGVVYRAYDERLDRQVAIKLVSPDKSLDARARERLRREARASACLSHPAIVRTYDWLESDDTDAIVMELVEGTSLNCLLREGPFDFLRALAVGRQIAEALAEAHGKGIVHRDLKAENVIFTPAGDVKVLDFGIAKHLELSQTDLTGSGVVIGTCRAMSPEQAQGQEVDHRTDLFSLGSLLYELVTGQSPFLSSSLTATLWRVCSHRQRPARAVNPKVPEPLSCLIDQLLEKQPHLRPASAREVASTLATIAAGIRKQGPADEERREAGEATVLEIPFAPAAQVSAERRQMTILYCGIVRDDGMPLDPEDLLDFTPRLREAADEILKRFGGLLRPAIGEGFLGSFGYPEAHEDDVRRAVYAALEIAEYVRHNGPAQVGSLRARIGIDTGSMVIRRGAEAGVDLTGGDTPHVAALLHRLAPPGAVLISEAAHKLSGGFLQCEALEPAYLPGSPEALRAYRVLSDTGAHTRIETAKILTPLVAREQEVNLLLTRWALAREGRGQVVLVAGEAGLGKSRLVWELRRRMEDDAAVCLESWASPFYAGSAFYAVLQWLRQWLGMAEQEAAATQLARLEKALSGLPLDDFVPLLAPLLSIPTDDRYVAPALSPDTRRRKTLEALLAILIAAAERQPLLLVMEDLHWTDPSSLELVRLIIEHAPGSSLLLLMTFRPEFQPPWGEPSYLVRLTLSPLTRAQAYQMIERLTGERHLHPALRDQVAVRTDGVPLFVEELTRMILEADEAAGTTRKERSGTERSLEIPATLEGWLRARLDRLATAREVAQIASVIGREFSFELLHAVSPWSDTVLELELDRLVEAEIVYKRGFGQKCHYLFKHALLQDAAYASLLRSDRQKHHRRVAEALESRFPAKAENHPELVAHHYTEAGLPDRAFPFWQRAGQEAHQSFAFREAADYLARAVEALRELPESIERDRQELALLLNLGVARGRSVSYGAPDVEVAFKRSLELCNRIGSRPELIRALQALSTAYMVCGKSRLAVEFGQQAYDLARFEDDPVRNSTCHRLGFALVSHGEPALARPILEEGMANPIKSTSSDPSVRDADVFCEVTLGWALWLLGFPDRATLHCRQALEKGDKALSCYTQGFAQFFAAVVFSLLDESQVVGELGEKVFILGVDNALPLWEDGGRFFQVWSLFERSQDPARLGEMRAAIAKYKQKGSLTAVPHFFALLAVGCLRTGCATEGLAAIDEAIALARQGEQVFFDAELHRLRGELIASQNGPDAEIELSFQEALTIARRQGVRSLELRTAMSLARHWRHRDRREEGRKLLQGVYGTFTEGFDTRDLREARSLLDGLS